MRRRDDGYTLVELVLVIAVTAVVVCLVGGQYREAAVAACDLKAKTAAERILARTVGPGAVSARTGEEADWPGLVNAGLEPMIEIEWYADGDPCGDGWYEIWVKHRQGRTTYIVTPNGVSVVNRAGALGGRPGHPTVNS